jgi:hypothetical protein
MRVTQFVNGNRGIHVLLARDLLQQLPCTLDLFAQLPAVACKQMSPAQRT